MTKQLVVVYESGVLRPLEPLPFAEKQHLVVTVTDVLRPTVAFNAREREQEWLRLSGSQYEMVGNRRGSAGYDAAQE
jgi:predicted DNA-binding antitoxin AbrB/MazE fold protein